MLTVTGNLKTILGPAAISGSVEVMLCGYGSQIPRNVGDSLLTRVVDGDRNIPVDSSGAFSFNVPPNDHIQPAGTYYTVTAMDDNGDVVQVNAYRFTSDVDTWNLNDLVPYNPTFPPPPVPVLLGNMLLPVAYSPAPNFPGDVYPTWIITLAGDVTAATFTGLADGNLYTLIIQQDATGGHKFNAPANLINFAGANPDPNATTVQTFIAVGSELYPIGPATWWTP